MKSMQKTGYKKLGLQKVNSEKSQWSNLPQKSTVKVNQQSDDISNM